MSLVWREQLSVCNDVIDADHKYLIDIINRVEQALLAKNEHVLATALDDLAQYSQVHFKREEKIATAAGYTQVPGLSQSHQRLMDSLQRVRGEIDAMGAAWSPEVIGHFTQFLRNWLIDHVIKEDLLIKPVLQKQSPGFDPL